MADNLAYQDDYTEEYRSEMLNGITVMMAPRPTTRHNRVLFNIAYIFETYLRKKTCRTFTDGTDVYLTTKDRVIPDVMIVCNKDIIKRDGVHGVPDLMVEVLSRGTAKRDRGYKKDLYERCGVREYWIVDPDSRSVDVYHLQNEKFVLDDVYQQLPADVEEFTPEEIESAKTEIAVSLYSDLTVSLDDIFYNLS